MFSVSIEDKVLYDYMHLLGSLPQVVVLAVLTLLSFNQCKLSAGVSGESKKELKSHRQERSLWAHTKEGFLLTYVVF